MAAISDSSPLILFSKIGELDLLRRLFDELVISPGVRDEVIVAGKGRLETAAIAAAEWVVERELTDPGLALRLQPALGRGEAEAIALGVELGGSVPLLLDDNRARQVTRALGLTFYGCAGILGLAKGLGIVRAVRPRLDSLRAAGLYLSDRTYLAILAEAGEPEMGP